MKPLFANVFLALALTLQPVAAQPIPGASEALNALRVQAGRGPVAPDPRLQTAADAHVADMARGDFFSHEGSDGSSVADRVLEAGYGYCVVAENIAMGQRDLTEVMAGWQRSRPHRRNMLSREVTGFGLARGPGDRWVLVLGRDGC